MNTIKIIAHSDAHGVCVGVSASRRLTQEGHQVDFYYQYPQTQAKKFWQDTLPNLDLSGYDELLILDIPFDRDAEEECVVQLHKLSQQIKVTYIDHHDSTVPLRAPNLSVEKRKSPNECYYIAQDRLTLLGAICDRDVTIAAQITDEQLTIAEGIDWAIKGNKIEPKTVIEKLAQEDFDFFKRYSGQIPLPRSCKIGNVTVVDTSQPEMSNIIFKSIEKAVEVQQTPYGLGLTRGTKLSESPDELVDVLTMIRYWRDASHPSVRELIDSASHPILKKYQDQCFYFGEENNLRIKLKSDPKQMAEVAGAIIELFTDYYYSDYIGKRIVIGGPPNSGKSSFMYSLESALKDVFGVEANAPDLDLMSPTKKLIRGEISQEQRESEKKPKWTLDLAQEAKQLFLDSEGDIILGDTPGKIDEITELIVEPADSAFIVSRDAQAFGKWQDFFENKGIKVIAEFISALDTPTEHLSVEGQHQVSFLNRCLYAYNPIILTLALLLASNLRKQK